MNFVNVIVRKENLIKDHLTVIVEACDGYETAMKLSAAFPNDKVLVQSCARTWLVLENQQIAISRDWSDFYAIPARNTDAYDQYAGWIEFVQNADVRFRSMYLTDNFVHKRGF